MIYIFADEWSGRQGWAFLCLVLFIIINDMSIFFGVIIGCTLVYFYFWVNGIVRCFLSKSKCWNKEFVSMFWMWMWLASGFSGKKMYTHVPFNFWQCLRVGDWGKWYRMDIMGAMAKKSKAVRMCNLVSSNQEHQRVKEMIKEYKIKSQWLIKCYGINRLICWKQQLVHVDLQNQNKGTRQHDCVNYDVVWRDLLLRTNLCSYFCSNIILLLWVIKIGWPLQNIYVYYQAQWTGLQGDGNFRDLNIISWTKEDSETIHNGIIDALVKEKRTDRGALTPPTFAQQEQYSFNFK